MGGGVMTEPDLASSDVDALVRQVGCLPDAPMVMPKQRLERPASPGLFTRLFAWPPMTGGARTSGS